MSRASTAPRSRRAAASWLVAVSMPLLLGLVLPATSLAGTPARKAFKQGVEATTRGDWDWAVLYFQRASDLRPGDVEYGRALVRAKEQASYAHFETAKKHLFAGNLREAISELQQTVTLNPSHQYAYVELEKAIAEWKKRQAEADAEAGAMERMREDADKALGNVPKLDPKSNIPIQFSMTDYALKDVFQVIQDVSNINVIYDEGVKLEEKISLHTDNVTLEEALDLLMVQQGLTYKVYNDHTILVYPDNPTKRREYEDQVIRTFYLSNADVKEVNGLLRGVIDMRKAAVNEDLNAITIKDTQDKIAIAGKIIEQNDKAKAELVIDLEILEVNRSKLKSYGIDITTGGAGGVNSTIGFDDDQIRLNNLRRLNQLGSYILSPLPSAIVSLVRNDSDTRVLSRPQVRVTDGEKVTVHLGDEVPIPNTTINTNTTVGGNVTPITSYTYQKVGIEIELEPRIHHNREITLKLQAEVSSVTSFNSAGQPTIGERQVQTVIRLRDGEPNLLAGLFQQSSSHSDSGIPGVMDVPILRKIFGAHDRSEAETEIVLTVTPHIIRVPDITAADLAPLHVGTEKNTQLRGFTETGVGGSPFRGPDEKPPEDPFTSLQPGEQQRDRDALVNPDVGLAAGRDAEAAAAAAESSPATATPAAAERPEPAEPGGFASPEPGPAPPPAPPATPGQPTGPVEISLVNESGNARVGATFAVSVRVDTHGHELAHAPYHVTYDASRAEAISATEGNFFGAAGLQAMFMPSLSAGRVVIGHSQFGGSSGAVGTGILAVLTFRSLQPGPVALAFDRVTLSDLTNEALPARSTGTTVNVEP